MMRRATWVGLATAAAAAVVVGLSSGHALAKKPGGGGGGGGGGSTTSPDIAFTVGSETLYVVQDDGSGMLALASGSGRASWSPDGTQVAVWSDVDGPGIYVVDLAGGQPAKVTATNKTWPDSSWVAWSPAPAPDGEFKLAFVDWPLNADGTVGGNGSWSDVFLVNLDGTGRENVTQTSGHEREISWSPDARQLACLTLQRICVVDLSRRDAAGLPTRHIVYSGSAGAAQAEWARTGNRIVFSASNGAAVSPMHDLFVFDVAYAEALGSWNGSTPVNITNTPDDEELAPSWSPDDSRVVCQNAQWRSSRKGRATLSLEVVTVTTGARATLLGDDVQRNYPVWKRSAP